MKCKPETVALMHKYLDGELKQEEERELRTHLQQCSACQNHFHELKRTITMVGSSSHINAPPDFTKKVMAGLPKQKKRNNVTRWLRHHPLITAAAVFFLLMFSGVFSAWNQDQQVTVSKQENLIIKEDMVIVPEGVTVKGDLVVRNGDLKIEGAVDGDVTMINGQIITDDTPPDNPLEGEKYMAYVSGEVEEVNQVFEWMWYHVKDTFKDVFSLN
ncbi:zf-HC2 domain-containing protein [Thalassobacillus hwangdonensis]|uniref:Anti-sigma-W factor RsiW n=1 Tax=Thalassobacillus hwangdonensis TaxID=546108 RepID=A0ABW3L1Y3_9BACI